MSVAPAIPAIVLVGGEGIRARPMSLTSADYLRSKAAITLAGKTIMEWTAETLRAQGVRRIYVIAKGRENRLQTKAILGHGEQHGIQVCYSRTRLDRYNTGSGEATLRALEHWNIRGPALIVPSDSVFNFDLAAMTEAHATAGAAATVATVARTPQDAAGKYGVLVTSRDGAVTRFLEKPALPRLREACPYPTVATNAGIYLIDCDQLRMAGHQPDLARMAGKRLDWGGDLLPWLVASGHRVQSHPIPRFGDLGNLRDYLQTARDVLSGDYPLLSERIEPLPEESTGARVHPSTLHGKTGPDSRTLAERVAEGTVRLGRNVRIGRDAEIGDRVWLADCDIGDGVDIGTGSILHGVVCGDYSIIGPGATIRDAVLGCMVEVESTAEQPVVIENFCALGDAVHVCPGARLRGVSVYPGLRVRPGIRVPAGASLTGVRDIVRGLSGAAHD